MYVHTSQVIQVCACRDTCVQAHIHTRMCTRIDLHTYTCVHIHIPHTNAHVKDISHTYIYKYICTPTRVEAYLHT